MKQMIALLLLVSVVHADQKTSTALMHHVQLGPDVFWSHYCSGAGLDTGGSKLTASINGYYGGLRVAYDYLQPDALYAGTEGVIAWGRDDLHIRRSESNLSPTGCNPSSHQSVHERRARLFANIEQRLGYNAQSTILPRLVVTPYLGLGWHHEGLAHDSAHWYYGAAGLKTMQKFYKHFELGMDLKLMYGFDIHDRGFISVAITQGRKTFWGLEAALPLRWLIGSCEKWDIEFKPYLLKLNLNSPQTIVGARLMLGYSL